MCPYEKRETHSGLGQNCFTSAANGEEAPLKLLSCKGPNGSPPLSLKEHVCSRPELYSGGLDEFCYIFQTGALPPELGEKSFYLKFCACIIL